MSLRVPPSLRPGATPEPPLIHPRAAPAKSPSGFSPPTAHRRSPP